MSRARWSSACATRPAPNPLPHPSPEVWFSFGAIQGMLEPLTPLGQETIRIALAGAARLVGRRVDWRTNRFIQPAGLKPLRVVVNVGNGVAGHMVKALAKHLPFEFIWLYPEPDGTFPHGIPNPLLPENRQATSEVVLAHHADLGVAWDGDADRCFVFDEHGHCVEGYYVVGLLAEAFL